MPSLPLVVSGLIKNSNSVNEENALIAFTTSLGVVLTKSNANGQYLVDLAGVGYVADETVTYAVNDDNNNQVYFGSISATGGTIDLNVTLAERTDNQRVNSPGNTNPQIHTIGGKSVSKDNTFPVSSYGLYNTFSQDASTEAATCITYEHHEIHGGSHYYIEGTVTLGLGGTFYVKLVTPDTKKWSHFVWRITSNGILTTTLVEAPTGGMAGGAGVTPFNNDRNSSNTSGVVITSGVTACTGGIAISTEAFGSKSAGGSISRGDEIILKQNTTYCRTFVSGTAGNIVSFKASWYEHTNKN